MKSNEKGFVTIEAVLSLTTFMFVIVTFLVTINISVAQAKIAVAINTTAREISQYSYLYGLTGFNESTRVLAESAEAGKNTIDSSISNINIALNAMQGLNKDSGRTTGIGDPQTVLNTFSDVAGSAEKIESSGGELASKIQTIASDPKTFIMAIAKLAASDGLEYGKSQLIAAPLAKAMVQKHLQNYSGQSSEAFLKELGVVPGATGSYLDGLDFTQSTLFLYGSDDIRLVVKYRIKIIQLLPIENVFSFTQTAITKGWLCGDALPTKTEADTAGDELVANDTLWTYASIEERADIIRNLKIKDLKLDGYFQTKGLTQVQMYNMNTGDFVLISSTNPLYSEPGALVKTIDDIDEAALKETYKRLAGQINSDLDGLTKVVYQQDNTKITVNLTGNETRTIKLVIPEDPGLKEKMQAVLDAYDTGNVTIELVTGFGNGVNSTISTAETSGAGQ